MKSKNKYQKVASQLAQVTLLHRITNRIRQSLELQEILACTVQEIRSFLQVDRVKIYKFHPDGTGQVIAESIAPNRLPSLLGLHFPAGDIPPHAREMFIRARMRSIVDVPQQRITLSCLDCPETTGDLTVEEVQSTAITEILQQRPVDPCHVEYLTAMGVQSSLVIPILHHQQLWGLLAAHHAQPKAFKEQELQIVQMVADQLAIAIAQSHLLSQTREQAHREELINQISTLLHSPFKIQEILQSVLERIIHSVQGSGGRLYLAPIGTGSTAELYTYNDQPRMSFSEPQALLEDRPFWQQLMNEGQVKGIEVKAIADLYQEMQLVDVIFAFKPTRIRSLLVMPLRYSKQSLGCLTIFRNEIDTDITWAGRFDPDERNSRVRDSFAAWRELKRGQSQEWTVEEVELVQSLGNHLTMAVMQNWLYQYEHQQRLLLEMRNQELNVARSVAEEASRLKSDFLSSTSHELRTPLASTLNYLKLLKEGFYDNEEELKEYINIAYQSAENLVSLINDVLDLAKIEAGRMVVTWETFELQALLEELCRIFRLDSDRKGIPLIIDCQVERIYADKVKLRQILTNLLSNAFKFTHAGQIYIKANEQFEASLVEISVIDTGIGIDSEQKDLLFEPFVQADGSIKRRYGGTGLGLTVCKRLVELMGGKIWLESAGLSQGTTVVFTIPLV